VLTGVGNAALGLQLLLGYELLVVLGHRKLPRKGASTPRLRKPHVGNLEIASSLRKSIDETSVLCKRALILLRMHLDLGHEVVWYNCGVRL
jgi:hypothetical protein